MILDGIPNGACFDDNTCADINAYCSTETNRCICRAGYTEDQEQCIQGEDEIYHTFPKQQISDSSKQTEVAEDNFEFDENGRKCSKRAENTVGKGEIARHEQFLLFSQCFQTTCTVDM